MVWACFSQSGLGMIHFVEGMMDSKKYINVLENFMLPSAGKLFDGAYIFQDDNARCHRSKLVNDWIDSKNIERMI